jgi:hypothetical protein
MRSPRVLAYVDIKIHTCGWRRMMTVIPIPRMMVVMIVIMVFGTTRQECGDPSKQKGGGQEVF